MNKLNRLLFTTLFPDTIRDTDSPSIIRRFSTLLHSSFMSTRNSTRRSSEASSVNSTLPRNASTSSPTHTLLKRATAKTAKGSSIIKKDGSLIITKNGKIISVRQDRNAIKRDQSFSGFDGVDRHTTNGVSKSLSEINVARSDRIELTPLLHRQRTRDTSCNSISSQSSFCGHRDGAHNFHASLSKIESVDETECIPENDHGSERYPARKKSREVTSPIEMETVYNYSPSIKSDEDDVFVKSPITINCNSQELDLNTLSVKPNIRQKGQLSKSDMRLDKPPEQGSGNTLKEPFSDTDKSKSKSSDLVFTIPLLRCPSVERLDLPPTAIPRCSSDATALRKLKTESPLYKRRFLMKKKGTTEKT